MFGSESATAIVADRADRDLAVGDRHPGRAAVGRPEHAAAGDAHIEGARLRRHAGDRRDAAAARRTDEPVLQPLEQRRDRRRASSARAAGRGAIPRPRRDSRLRREEPEAGGGHDRQSKETASHGDTLSAADARGALVPPKLCVAARRAAGSRVARTRRCMARACPQRRPGRRADRPLATDPLWTPASALATGIARAAGISDRRARPSLRDACRSARNTSIGVPCHVASRVQRRRPKDAAAAQRRRASAAPRAAVAVQRADRKSRPSSPRRLRGRLCADGRDGQRGAKDRARGGARRDRAKVRRLQQPPDWSAPASTPTRACSRSAWSADDAVQLPGDGAAVDVPDCPGVRQRLQPEAVGDGSVAERPHRRSGAGLLAPGTTAAGTVAAPDPPMADTTVVAFPTDRGTWPGVRSPNAVRRSVSPRAWPLRDRRPAPGNTRRRDRRESNGAVCRCRCWSSCRRRGADQLQAGQPATLNLTPRSIDRCKPSSAPLCLVAAAARQQPPRAMRRHTAGRARRSRAVCRTIAQTPVPAPRYISPAGARPARGRR